MKIAIIGAGGFGREVLALIRSINSVRPTYEVIGFIDDGISKGTSIQDLTVLGSVSDIAGLGIEGVAVAIGNSQVRKRVVEKLPNTIDFPNFIHPEVQILDEEHVSMGKGNIICAGNILTTDIAIHDFCIINLSCTIGHDAVLNNFSSIMPGVNISGGAQLLEGAYIGTGAKLIKATAIGRFSTIGAGAVVDTDIPENTVAVGIPARPIKTSHE